MRVSKGTLGYSKWHVSHMGFKSYIAERIVDDELEQLEFSSHCLACAKVDVLAKRGGRVDLRGWHRQGICGSFLAAMAVTVEEEGEG